MHTEKLRIFDAFAKSKGFDGWFELQNNTEPLQLAQYVFDACDLVQQEQQKRIAEGTKKDLKSSAFIKSLNSITNPKNLIS